MKATINQGLNSARMLKFAVLVFGLFIYVVIGAYSVRPQVAQGQSQPAFSCSNNLYLAQNSSNTQLKTLDIEVSPATLSSIGGSYSAGYNSMGFRFADGYLYAYNPSDDHFVRIGSNGSVSNIGNDASIPDVGYAAGDFDADGYHNMLQYTNDSGTGNTNQWTITDLSGGTPSMVDEFTLTNDTGGGLAVGDVAFNPKDGKFYGVDMVNKRVVMIEISGSSGTVTHFGPVQNSFANSGAHGAAYINAKGELISVQNNPGRIFKIDIGENGNGSGAATLMSNSPTVSQYDGASCPYVPLIEKTVEPGEVLAGQTAKYEYTIYNPIPTQSLTMTFEDEMEDGRTYVAGTLSNDYGGTPNSYGGTSNLVITGMTVPASDTISFTVDVKIPEDTPSGTLYNQACINAFSIDALVDEVCSDYPVTPLFGDPTPLDVVGVDAPDTGFALLKNNPWAVLTITVGLTTAIVVIARKFNKKLVHKL